MPPSGVFRLLARLGGLGERPLRWLFGAACGAFVLLSAPLYRPAYRRLKAASALDGVGYLRYLALFAGSFGSSAVSAALLSRAPAAPSPIPVDDAETWRAIEAARRGGRGVVLATPHLGDLVLLVSALIGRGLAVTLPMPMAESFRWLESERLKLAPLGAAAGACLAALTRNEAALLICDRDYFPGNRAIAFFGAEASPPHGAVRLAREAGAPILPLACLREPAGHRIVAEPAIDAAADAERAERELFSSFERLIRRAPAQWQIFVGPWKEAAR